MKTKWLEDFVSLAETRSFSRAAQLRHVTQPALSRRIQSLEAWAATRLVDRSSGRAVLTPAGHVLYGQALETIQALHKTRATLRAHPGAAPELIEFAVPHTLAFAFFPSWLSNLRETCGSIKSRLIASNMHDAVLRLVEGGCDLLIAYQHPDQPLQLDSERYEMLHLGSEMLSPYVRPDAEGKPLYALPGTARKPLPYLGYAPEAYLGQAVEHMLNQSSAPIHLERVYESDMVESLKAMALEGHGVAFLPTSAVRKDVHSRKLVSIGGALQTALEICIYRRRSLTSTPEDRLEQFWNDLRRLLGNPPRTHF